MIFYARGIYFDPGAQEVVKTGIILVDTNLPRVTVQLDEQEPRIESDPVAIRNVLPGRHHVAIWRDGYKTWQTYVDVQEEKVTRIEGATLFLAEPIASTPIQGALDMIQASPNAKHWLYTITTGDNAGLWLHTSSEEKNRRLFDEKEVDPAAIDNIVWSSDSETAVLAGKDSYLLVEPFRTQPRLRKIVSRNLITEFNDVQIDQANSTAVYYRTVAKDLFSLVTSEPDAKPALLSSDIETFNVGHPKIFAIRDKGRTQELISIDVRALENKPASIATLTGSELVQLQISTAAHVSILQDAVLSLLEREDGGYIFTALATSVTEAAWSNDARFLMYQRAGEIWVHDEDPIEGEEPEALLTRLSRPVAELQWRDDNQHVLFLSRDPAGLQTIKSLLVSRNAPLTQEIIQLPQDANAETLQLQFIAQDRDVLYVSGTGNKKTVNLVTIEASPNFSFPDLLP